MIQIDPSRVSRGASCRKHGDPAWTIPRLNNALPCPECWYGDHDTDEVIVPEYGSRAGWREGDIFPGASRWIAVAVVVTGCDGAVWVPWAWELQN